MNAHTVLAQVDPRRVVLLRAAIRHDQVDRGEKDIDCAFLEVVAMVDAVMPCSRCDNAEFADRPAPKPKPRPTPQATIDAVKYCVRTRGSAALDEPANLARLRSFDRRALADLDAWLQKKGFSR
jgi:hypothetical protein